MIEESPNSFSYIAGTRVSFIEQWHHSLSTFTVKTEMSKSFLCLFVFWAVKCTGGKSLVYSMEHRPNTFSDLPSEVNTLPTQKHDFYLHLKENILINILYVFTEVPVGLKPIATRTL